MGQSPRGSDWPWRARVAGAMGERSSPAQSATFSLEKVMASVRGVRAQFQEAAHIWPPRRGLGGDAMSFAATSGAKAWDELLIVKMSGKQGLASEDIQEPDLEVRCGACASFAALGNGRKLAPHGLSAAPPWIHCQLAPCGPHLGIGGNGGGIGVPHGGATRGGHAIMVGMGCVCPAPVAPAPVAPAPSHETRHRAHGREVAHGSCGAPGEWGGAMVGSHSGEGGTGVPARGGPRSNGGEHASFPPARLQRPPPLHAGAL